MIQLQDKTKCCGCTACQTICPQNAISMQEDSLGFKYPKINLNLCIDCGLCEKVCVFTEAKIESPIHENFPIVYGAQHIDLKEVATSQSGAAFIGISNYVLKIGGIIYGVGFGTHFKTQHKRATTQSQRDEFKGSKYVQSDLNDIFQQVKKDLKESKTVLFSGTPCQVSGLLSYLGPKKYTHLICVDIVCHGVPSPKIWSDYIHYIENKYQANILKVNFRDKKYGGWRHAKESYLLSNNQTISLSHYTDMFHEKIMLRPSCSICRYTTIYRESDFTIADFWGIQKVNKTLYQENKGCSLIFINNPKAKTLFDKVQSSFKIIPTASFNDYAQPNLKKPTVPSKKAKNFEQNYLQKGIKHYIARNKRLKIKAFILRGFTLLFNPKLLIKRLIKGKH